MGEILGKRELAIEAGIPCPGPKGGTGPRKEPARVAHKMKIGDSVLCDSPSEMEGLRRAIYSLGGKAARRAVQLNGHKQWRVWRVA